MTGVLVQYRGRPAALVGVRQLSFLGDVRHLPPGDPLVRFVAYMAFYAQLVLTGEMAPGYTDNEAERFARLALVPPDELAPRRRRSDAALAAHFRVPLEQIARARAELGETDGP
jgi:hypothetical protein